MDIDTTTKTGKLSRSESGKLGYLKSKDKHEEALKKRLASYNSSPKICKKCSSIIPYNRRQNIFCSHICSGQYNNIKKEKKMKPCLFCKQLFSPSENRIKYCSKSCSSKMLSANVIKKWRAYGIYK